RPPSLTCFFFFQAEDGIRDFHVTGVQTCALPISWCDHEQPPGPIESRTRPGYRPPPCAPGGVSSPGHSVCCPHPRCPNVRRARQIGRASCRERAYMEGGDVLLKGKDGSG